VISVLVREQATAHAGERHTVHECRRNDVRSKVEEQVVAD
jgi:hypothetical protein